MNNKPTYTSAPQSMAMRGLGALPSSSIDAPLPQSGARNKPVAKFKAGAVNATIWANTAKGQTGDVQFFSVALDRRYMDKNGQWQSTSSLRVNDLPKAALVLQKAYEHLVLQDTGESGNAMSGYALQGTAVNLTEEEVLIV